jgi:hypothetical protein
MISTQRREGAKAAESMFWMRHTYRPAIPVRYDKSPQTTPMAQKGCIDECLIRVVSVFCGHIRSDYAVRTYIVIVVYLF